MSCGPVEAKFRLLDAYVGWSEKAAPSHLIGLDDPAGLRLAPASEEPALAELWKLLLPPRLARGCGPCDWYLLTPDPSRLLTRQACSAKWRPVWIPACDPGRFVDPIAVAAWQHRVAIADRGAGRIWIWEREGLHLIAEIEFPDVLAIGYTAAGELLAVQGTRAGGSRLHIFGPSGERRRRRIALPAEAWRAEVVASGSDRAIWLLTRHDGSYRLWRAAPDADRFIRADLAGLQASMTTNGLSQVTERGFCLIETGRDGLPVTRCQDWYGRSCGADEVGVPSQRLLHEEGELFTVALDSGMPRCRWHRVQVDADLPAGTGLLVQTASVDEPGAQPHANDWKPLAASSLDFLIDQPPGRYLHVRLRLTGDGSNTPVVRRVRLDFPRSSSLEFLPPVYREDPRAEDFTERFLSLFDAGIAELDNAIERFPALLDVQGVPDSVLPWLATFLDLTFDPAWEPSRQRAILRALPRLYRLRGTIAGLRLAIQVVFDTEPAIQEAASERMWRKIGRRGNAVLRGTRLFGRSKARFTLGRSRLCTAPLKSYGNPDHDPVGTGAHRFRVLVPPGALTSGAGQRRLARLVESQKPAHTQATVRVGGSGLLIGSASAVGVDSVLGPLPAPVIGQSGNVRLRRMSVLWPSRRGRRPVFVLGNPVVAGVQTVME